MSGSFYPGSAKKLSQELAEFLPAGDKLERPIAIMAPHAGYRYSGAAAGAVYSKIEVPSLAIVLCPNHTGRGQRISVWAEGAWQTPLGEVPVDESAAAAFLKACAGAKADRAAHELEHSAEVQLPFLQTRNPGVRILPICLGPLTESACEEVGRALAKVAEEIGRDETLLVASSDMSHYISAEEAKAKDRLALEKFERRDAKGLYETVVREDISMCGFIPTTSVLAAGGLLGGKRAEILKYTHSGMVTGDHSSVVAYAAGWVLA